MSAETIRADLSQAELVHLTCWKWTYAFEAMGFTAAQAHQLAFLTWLHMVERI